MQELVQSFLDLTGEVLFVIELAGNCLRLCRLALKMRCLIYVSVLDKVGFVDTVTALVITLP